MGLDFLSPLNDELVEFIKGLTSQHLGSKIVLHTEKEFPDLKKIRLAIVGVLENRGDKTAINYNGENYQNVEKFRIQINALRTGQKY